MERGKDRGPEGNEKIGITCESCGDSSVPLTCHACSSKMLQPLAEEIFERIGDRRTKNQLEIAEKRLYELSREEHLLHIVDDFREGLKGLSERVRQEKKALDAMEAMVDNRRTKLQERRANFEQAKKAFEQKCVSILGSEFQTSPDLSGTEPLDKNGEVVDLESESIISALSKSLNLQASDFKDSIARERRAKVLRLAEVFPIQSPLRLGEDGEGSIAGFCLPTSIAKLGSMSHEDRSTVMLILTRVVCLTAKYLNLCLPYDLRLTPETVLIGCWDDSESQMLDLTESGPTLQPAVEMLSVCVETLCFRQGVPIQDVLPNQILHNLWQVFHSPSLGRTVHQSILDADGRIGLRDKQTKEQKRRKGTLTNAELLEMESQLDFDLSSLSDDLDDQADAMMPTSVLLHQPSESNALVDSFSVY